MYTVFLHQIAYSGIHIRQILSLSIFQVMWEKENMVMA